MTDKQPTAVPVEDGEASELRSESADLERRRALNHARFRWCFFGGLFLFVMGAVFIGAADGHWLPLAPAMVAFAAATSFYARERGRHPAWGLLSVPGLALLNIMPDLPAERLDRIDRLVSGKPPRRISGERISRAVFWPLIPLVAPLLDLETTSGIPSGALRLGAIVFAPLGLYQAVRLLIDSREQGKSPVLPIAVVVWAGFFNAVAANVLVRFFDR